MLQSTKTLAEWIKSKAHICYLHRLTTGYTQTEKEEMEENISCKWKKEGWCTYILIRQNRLEKKTVMRQIRVFCNDKGINTIRKYNNYKYLHTQ